MKYAVEAKIFDNGKVMARVRLARDGEESGYAETRRCVILVDIFDDPYEAARYCEGYRKT